MTYSENWNLICKIYRQFNGAEKEKEREKSVTNENKWQQKVEMKN